MTDQRKPKIKVIIDGQEFEAVYREFKSGKKGYGLYETVKIESYPFRLIFNMVEF